ncbi:hypothetical protein TNCV_4456021 [Trichonephila clavipes]|nr:hypothetical protein TNCV_4456021 [Trichonephila clavipes]
MATPYLTSTSFAMGLEEGNVRRISCTLVILSTRLSDPTDLTSCNAPVCTSLEGIWWPENSKPSGQESNALTTGLPTARC